MHIALEQQRILPLHHELLKKSRFVCSSSTFHQHYYVLFRIKSWVSRYIKSTTQIGRSSVTSCLYWLGPWNVWKWFWVPSKNYGLMRPISISTGKMVASGARTSQEISLRSPTLFNSIFDAVKRSSVQIMPSNRNFSFQQVDAAPYKQRNHCAFT